MLDFHMAFPTPAKTRRCCEQKQKRASLKLETNTSFLNMIVYFQCDFRKLRGLW
jgi:hypothetical protein